MKNNFAVIEQDKTDYETPDNELRDAEVLNDKLNELAGVLDNSIARHEIKSISIRRSNSGIYVSASYKKSMYLRTR